MNIPAILISAVMLLIVSDAHSQVRDPGAAAKSNQVGLGDVIWEGMTYQNALGEIIDTGDIKLLGASSIRGTGKESVIPWEKAPWDIKKKMEKTREAAIASFKAKPRMEASPGMLLALWGKPAFSETEYVGVSVLKFNTPEYLIDAYFEKQRVVMMEVERKAGWTPESTEAVLQTMADGEWRYENDADIWITGNTRAKMATPKRLRVMSWRWTYIAKTPVKKPDAGL